MPASLPPSAEPGPELAFLMAFWDAWQALAARGEARRRQRHGLDLRSFVALASVQAAPCGPARLARELGVPRYEVSRVLSALETRGALTRDHAGPDGRRARHGAGRGRAAARRPGAGAALPHPLSVHRRAGRAPGALP